MRSKNQYKYNAYRHYSYSGVRNTYTGGGFIRKRKKHTLFIVVISVLFVLSACTAAFFIMGGVSAFTDNSSSAAFSEFLDKPQTEHMSYKGEKYESKAIGAESYIINYPSTGIESVDKEIENRVTYLSRCAEASSSRFTAIDYISETADGKYLSLVFKAKEYDSDKNQTSAYVSTMIFDLDNKKLLSDDEVFKKSFYKFASEYVRNYFEGNSETSKLTKDKAFVSATTADKLHFEEYSISDTKCTLYMNQKELFGSGNKIYDISISLSELSGYFEIPLKNAKNTAEKASTIRDDIDPNKPMLALTFDDGPDAENTEVILDVLKKYNSRATFFVVGYNAEEYPEILKAISDSGCQIGNHTKNHANLTELTDKEVKEAADYVDKIVKNVTGNPTTALRPPYGAYSEKVQQLLNKTPFIFWSIDTKDWENSDKDKTVKAVMEQAYDGSIILMHDIQDSTAEAVKEIVPKLISKGYQLVTVEELLYYKDIDIQGGETYPW